MLSRIRRSRVKEQGFTLIELLVVIIIIGILAAIAIPVFLNQRRKGVDASLKSDLHNAAAILETWAIDNPATATGWQEVFAPGTDSGVLKGLKVSAGTRIGLLDTTTVGGYCLFASNPNATQAVENTHEIVYRSLLGGLQPTLSVGAGVCV